MTHGINLTLEDGAFGIHAEFVCQEPDGADCHCGCERPECEEGCICHANGQTPQRKDWGECLLCTWLSESGMWTEQYKGPKTEPRSGLIEIEWQPHDAYYTWRYANTTTERHRNG